MPERKMTRQEMEEFLSECHVANLATLKREGSPHLAPLWYEYRDGRVYFITGESYVKVRNILRDPRVAVSVATDQEPYKYVVMEGNAEVTSEDAEGVTFSICIRYRGQDRGASFAREILKDDGMVVIMMTPDKIITWLDG